MTPGNAAEILSSVNGKLRRALQHFRPERHSCLSIQAEDLSSLLRELVRAGECLREVSADGANLHPELERERSEYQSNLTELERLLPDFSHRLLAERSRLLEARQHLESAAEWAGSHRNTL